MFLRLNALEIHPDPPPWVAVSPSGLAPSRRLCHTLHQRAPAKAKNNARRPDAARLSCTLSRLPHPPKETFKILKETFKIFRSKIVLYELAVLLGMRGGQGGHEPGLTKPPCCLPFARARSRSHRPTSILSNSRKALYTRAKAPAQSSAAALDPHTRAVKWYQEIRRKRDGVRPHRAQKESGTNLSRLVPLTLLFSVNQVRKVRQFCPHPYAP